MAPPRPPSAVPLLLLHGFTGSARAWGTPLRSALTRLPGEAPGGSRTVIVPDLPGHGEDRTPPDPELFRIEAVVERMVGELDRRGIQRADWLGYSMGGRVALAAAVWRPERVRRLVLESASPGLEGAEERELRRREDEYLATRIEERGISWFVDHWMESPLFATQATLPASLRREARALRLGQDPHRLAAALRGLGTGVQPSLWEALPRVTAPTLLITGALDPKFVVLAERMRELLPHAEHRTLPGAGHQVHREEPEAWAETVVDFLR